MIRFRLFAAIAVLAGALGGCKDWGSKEKEGAASVHESPQPDKAAQDLLARRDALMKSRTQIQEERQKLEEERTRLVESGGDTSEVDQKLEAQASEEAKIANEDAVLADQMQSLLETARSQVASGDKQAQVASREASMASREKTVATREERIASREAALAAREKQLAEREKNTCGVAATPTIIQTVDPKGAKYSKRDVEPVLKKAREAMSKKGILASDLPAQAAGLEREATKSMAEGEYGPARFAAQQLLATVEAQRIDRAFISAKISRLSKAMTGRTLEPAAQKEVDDLFRDATAKYGDGDYPGANRKLNQIWRAID